MGCISVGIPRPSSVIVHDPSELSVVVMSVAWPANDSSTELSTTSQTRWCNPSGPVDPIYLNYLQGQQQQSTTIIYG